MGVYEIIEKKSHNRMILTAIVLFEKNSAQAYSTDDRHQLKHEFCMNNIFQNNLFIRSSNSFLLPLRYIAWTRA